MARKAKSLDILLGQIDGAAPGRDKSSDGWIADENHSPNSDHQPNADGVVTAIDITNDPAHGIVARRIAELLVVSRDPRIENIISDAQIISSTVHPWLWRPYSGPNAHRQHVHISVHNVPELYDDTRPWAVTMGAAQPTRPGMFTSITATVFADPETAYGSLVAPGWNDRPGVALPARFTVRPLPQVRVTHNGKSIVCPVIDVGPWNIEDRYWETGARPQAETGSDMTGRHTNLAGIDLTPAAANAIGLPGKGLVDWEFAGIDGEVLEPLSPRPPLDAPAGAMNPLLLILLLTMLTKERPVNNKPTQGHTQSDLANVLLPLILQSVISGKPLDANALLPALLQGILGVPLALPPPAPVAPPPTQPAAPAAPQGLNDMLLPLLLQIITGKSAAAPTAQQPVPPVVVAAPPVDPTVKPAVGASALALGIGSILQTLGVVGTPFGIGAEPTATGTLTTLIPLITGVAGAFGGFGPLVNIVAGLFSRKNK